MGFPALSVVFDSQVWRNSVDPSIAQTGFTVRAQVKFRVTFSLLKLALWGNVRCPG